MSVAIKDKSEKPIAKKAFKKRSLSEAQQREHFLEAKEEYGLACAWRDHKNEDAMHRIVNAHNKLAVTMASKFRRYKHVAFGDLVQDAQMGVMKAVEKFDPDKGVRFSTYAMWWIKASLQETVLKSQSQVRMGTTSEQKTLFFNLRRVQNEIEVKYPKLNSHEVNLAISDEMNIPLNVVEEMQVRMCGEYSLNTPISNADGDSGEWIDFLEAREETAETIYAEQEELSSRRAFLVAAIGSELNNRERDIFIRRRIQEKPDTLDDISQDYGVSKERIRQIEVQAFTKVQKAMLKASPVS